MPSPHRRCFGALGSEISSQEATNFYEMPAVRVSAARDVATSQTALSARVPARTKLGRGRRTQAEANARTTAACVKRTFQSDSASKSPSSDDCISHNAQPNCALKQTIISVTGHLECSSFDPMSAEHDTAAAAAPVPLLTAQVRVVENEGESSNN